MLTFQEGNGKKSKNYMIRVDVEEQLATSNCLVGTNCLVGMGCLDATAIGSLSDQCRFRPSAGADALDRFRVIGSAEHT